MYIDPNNNYPLFYGDIMNAVPDWKLGDDLPEGWIEISPTPFPDVLANEFFEEVFPIQVNGVWIQKFTIKKLTEQQVLERDLNIIRYKVSNKTPLTIEEATLLTKVIV